MSSKTRARDINAPLSEVIIGEKTYKLVFNNRCARVAEDVYELHYGQDVGYSEILRSVAKVKIKALMAMFFGALVAGGSEMTWPEFDEGFKFDSIPGVKEAILRGIEASLPKPQEGKEPNP